MTETVHFRKIPLDKRNEYNKPEIEFIECSYRLYIYFDYSRKIGI